MLHEDEILIISWTSQLCSEAMVEMAILMKLKFQGFLLRISINK